MSLINTSPIPVRSQRHDDSTSLQHLLGALLSGSDAAYESALVELLQRLCAALSVAHFSCKSRWGRTQRVRIARPAVLLRGFDKHELHVLLLADQDRTWTEIEAETWKLVLHPQELPVIIACDEGLEAFANSMVGENYCLVLGPASLKRLLTACDGLATFKCLLREKFSKVELQPFDDQHPLSGPLFTGRSTEMNTLMNNPRTSFAIVGPSKMGKTSLIQQYLEEIRVSRRERIVFYKSFKGEPVTEPAFARKIRMLFEPGLDAFYEPIEAFSAAVRKFSSRHPVPIELILDEVDAHVDLQGLKALVSLAQDKHFRLILVGRWKLARLVLHSQDEDFLRLRKLMLEALTVAESEEVIMAPLNDLGLDASSIEHEIRSCVRRCGCVPGHLHELGSRLVEAVHAARADKVSVDHVREAQHKLLDYSRVDGLLNDLSSPLARSAALLVAMQTGKPELFDDIWMVRLLANHGFSVHPRRARELCDELVLLHLLERNGDCYRPCRWDFVGETERRRAYCQAMLEADLAAAHSQEINNRPN